MAGSTVNNASMQTPLQTPYDTSFTPVSSPVRLECPGAPKVNAVSGHYDIGSLLRGTSPLPEPVLNPSSGRVPTAIGNGTPVSPELAGSLQAGSSSFGRNMTQQLNKSPAADMALTVAKDAKGKSAVPSTLYSARYKQASYYKPLTTIHASLKWFGVDTNDRQDKGKVYGYKIGGNVLMEGILKDNGKPVTPEMQVFIDSKTGEAIRISDFAEYPEQQGMLVLSDVLLTVGIVDDKRHVKRFIDTKMLNKRDDFGQKEFDICYVPSGNSAVSQFQNFCFVPLF